MNMGEQLEDTIFMDLYLLKFALCFKATTLKERISSWGLMQRLGLLFSSTQNTVQEFLASKGVATESSGINGWLQDFEYFNAAVRPVVRTDVDMREAGLMLGGLSLKAVGQSHDKLNTHKSQTKVDSEPPMVQMIDITNHMNAFKLFMLLQLLSLVTKKTDISYVRSSRNSNLMNMLQMMFEHSSSSLGLLCQMTFGQNSSSLILHQMMSVHISSGLVLHLDDV
ncbi:hypothetical protein Tco_1301596 [Tanacetum coccineum]